MIYFPHIPKSGGTTIKQVFDKNLQRENCIGVWDKQFGAKFSPQEFTTVNSNLINNYLAVYGHINVRTAMKNKQMEEYQETGRLLIISAVRDPVDRMISLFNFMRVNKRHPSHSYFVDLGLEGFVSFCKINQVNFQYHFLKKSDTDTVSDILNNIIVFSLSDSIKGFSSTLSLISGLPEIQYKKTNVTSERSCGSTVLYKKSDLPPALLAEIVKANNLDYELYERSQSNVEDKIQRINSWIEHNTDFIAKVRRFHGLSLERFIGEFDFDIESGAILPKEYVDQFRNMAVKFEKNGDIRTAEVLMSLAFQARPTGPFIKQKVTEYRDILDR